MDQYANPIYKILKYLENEKSRREQALNSNMFCDNKTIKSNIKILDKVITSMKEGIESEKV